MVQIHQPQALRQPISHVHGGRGGGGEGGGGGTTTRYPATPAPTPRSYPQSGSSTPFTPYTPYTPDTPYQCNTPSTSTPYQSNPPSTSTPYQNQRITSPKVTPGRRARLDQTPKPGPSTTLASPYQGSSPLQEPNPNLPYRTGFSPGRNAQTGRVKSPKTVTAGQFNAGAAGAGSKRPNANAVPAAAVNRAVPVKDVKEPLQKTIGFHVPGTTQVTTTTKAGVKTSAKTPVTGQVAARLAVLEKANRASGSGAGGQRPTSSRYQPPPPRHDPPSSSRPPLVYPGRIRHKPTVSSSASSYGPSSSSRTYTSDTSPNPYPDHLSTESAYSQSETQSQNASGSYPSSIDTGGGVKLKSKGKGKPYNNNRAMREMPQKTPRFLRQRAREAELEAAKRAEGGTVGTDGRTRTGTGTGGGNGTVVSCDGPAPKGEDVPDQLGSWRVGKEVGTGANGFVRVCRSTRTGRFGAIKVVPKVDFEPPEHPEPLLTRHGQDRQDRVDKMLNYLEREVAIMKMIDHPSLIRLWDVYETPANLYLLMEYVEGGELFDYLLDRRFFGPDECSHFFQQIVSGVQHLHQLKISHRDLKPENILLTRAYEIKVADFGLAALQPVNQLLESSCGSPHYAAPEIISGKVYEGPLVDVWSTGVMLFACLTGTLPFSADESDLKALLRLIILHEPEIPASVPSDARNLLKGMLQKDPQRRIQLADVGNHPFCRRTFVATVEHRESLARFWQGTEDDALDSVEEIDMSIFSAARCMLPRYTEPELLEALLSDEPNEAKLVYWSLIIEQKAEVYRENEGWTFAALMDDQTGIHGDNGKKWFPKSADPGPVKKAEREHKRGELIRTRDRFRYRRVCVPRNSDIRCRFRFKNYKRLSISVIMSRLINDIPGQRPYDTQYQSNVVSRIVHGPGSGVGRQEERSRRKKNGIQKTKATEIKRMSARRLPWINRQMVHKIPAYRACARSVLDRRGMSVKMARTIPWKEPREPSETGPGSGSEERQKFRSEILLYTHSLQRTEDSRDLEDEHGHRRHWLKVEVREWPAGMIPTARHLPPTPTFASPILGRHSGLAPSPILSNGNGLMALSPVMGYPPFSSAPPTPRPHVMISGPMSAVLPPAPFPGARGALQQIPHIAVSQFPFRPSQATAPPTTEGSSAQSYYIDHHAKSRPPAPDATSALLTGNPLMSAWTAPRPPCSPGGPRPLPTRRETAPAPSGSPAPTSSPAPAVQIPAVQPRRSPALTSGPKPVHGFQPTTTPTQSATPTQDQRSPGILATPRQPVYPPVPKGSRASPAPLVHPQPKRYERPVAPVGARPKAKGLEGSEQGTPSDIGRLNPNLLSPVTITGGQFSRPVPGGLRQGNRAAKPAPLPLQYTSAVGSPQSQNYSQLGSPMDTPNLSVLVTPTLGYEPTSPRGNVLQEMPNAAARRGWMNKAFGSNTQIYELLSPQDCTTTRNECSKVLSSFGAVVQVEDAENWGCLKVRSDEIRDVSGIMVNKPIRFKMEFAPKAIGLVDPMSPRSPRSPRSPAGGMRPTNRAPCTIITLTYEKGSADAFHAVYGRLKAEYGLGASADNASAYIAKQSASLAPPSPANAHAGLGMGLPEIPLGDAFPPEETAFIHRRSAALQ